MAARLNRMHTPWRFYVYAIVQDGETVYIGKGSGVRLQVQRGRFKLQGHEIARFWREEDAYQFEREAIKEIAPRLNVLPGGNGSRATPAKRARKWKEHRELVELGPRRASAKFLLGLPLERFNPPSEVEGIRQALRRVLDGPRC